MSWEQPWVIATVAALLGIATSMWIARWRRASRLRRRFERGAQAERAAVDLLRRRGYQVLDTQVDGAWAMLVDGRSEPARVRADLVVRRGRRTYVAEVKSGAKAPDPTTRATRRQLLEYAHAFGVSSVLLVDMEAKRIREVVFARPSPAVGGAALKAGIVGLAAGLLLEWQLGLLARWLQ